MELYRLFQTDAALPVICPVAPEQVPEPYRTLLAHPHHMTVTVEAHYGGPVNVRVLNRLHEGDVYARQSLLQLAVDGRVVQYGAVRIRLPFCSQPVCEAILAEQTPLGRILIEHDVLRRIEPTEYFRIESAPPLATWFGTKAPTYGRRGIIHCDEKPAIELLEILAPVPPSP